jgi:hypothetical protein
LMEMQSRDYLALPHLTSPDPDPLMAETDT